MNYIAEEKDVKETVLDFIKFCDYIEAKKPFSTQKGDLSTKACYEVNQLLKYPKKNAKHTDRMYQYSSVSLWFLVAKESGLIACNDGKSGKAVFDTTEAYMNFKKMNLFSQYLLIFNIWFCFVDIEAQYNERGSTYIHSNIIDWVFSQLREHSAEQWIIREEYNYRMFEDSPVQLMMAHCFKTAHNLMNLGLLVFEEGDISKYYHCPVIEKIKPTLFGACIMKACERRKYLWFNVYVEPLVDDGEVELYEKEMEAIETNNETFLTPFIGCFPQGSIDIATINKIVYDCEDFQNDSRILEFMVSLSKKCYRVIRCLPRHTFEALHLAIQDAFSFDDDILYSFYLDGKPYSYYSVNSPHSEMPPYTDEVCLGDIRLKNKQRILYIFDYGDEWEFEIIVNVTDGTDISIENPEIIKVFGKAPSQYPDYDEFS